MAFSFSTMLTFCHQSCEAIVVLEFMYNNDNERAYNSYIVFVIFFTEKTKEVLDSMSFFGQLLISLVEFWALISQKLQISCNRCLYLSRCRMVRNIARTSQDCLKSSVIIDKGL